MKSLFLTLVLFLSLQVQSNCFAVENKSDSTIKVEVSFYSNNYLIKGWLFKPVQTSKNKLPAIVMAPGFAGTKECNYQFYAENFSKEGFAVLLFDYVNFGESEGSNRQEVDPWLQIQAYRDGISFITTLEEIDPARIGIWGGSYSGGHVIVVSALDKRVKCVVAMTPFISGVFYLKNMPPPAKNFLIQQFNADRLTRVKGEQPAMIPVVSGKEGEFCAVSGKNAFNFVESFKGYAPNFKNKVTLKSLEMQLEYEPGTYITAIDSIPRLFIIAKKDEMIPEHLIVDVYNKASGPKKLVYLEGHHFSPYMEKLKEASDSAIEWFRANL